MGRAMNYNAILPLICGDYLHLAPVMRLAPIGTFQIAVCRRWQLFVRPFNDAICTVVVV